MSNLSPLDNLLIENLNDRIIELEQEFDADAFTMYGPITYGLDSRLYEATRKNSSPKEKALIILDTAGGIAEVVERMVHLLRTIYKEVFFVVPDKAMSAGTIFVMSGDRILMNPFSTLGPIDPQILKDERFIPALSYLNQYERLVEKSAIGKLTTAEFALIEKLDLAELDTFRQARDLSIELVKNWLSNYKFKDWNETATKKQKVTSELKKERAEKIASLLSNNERWHSHSRGITLDILRNELNLKIEDYTDKAQLNQKIHAYFDILADMLRQKSIRMFVHSKNFH